MSVFPPLQQDDGKDFTKLHKSFIILCKYSKKHEFDMFQHYEVLKHIKLCIMHCIATV